jgi:hypothetical protein
VASDVVAQLALGVGSSVITGTAVWLAQRARAAGRARARRRFLGLGDAESCRLVVGQGRRSPSVIHRRDVAAMLELATMLRAAGAPPRVLVADEAAAERTDAVEFCVSGPAANRRTGAHLRQHLPGLTVAPYTRDDDPDGGTFNVGGRTYHEGPDVEYAFLARICRAGRPHVFLIAGQTGITTHAAAVYLVDRLPALRRRFGDDATFCLVLRVLEPATFGHREVDEAADVTAAALTAP